jgi:hypothetical protein
MSSFTDRMIGAAVLNVQTYEEVESDTGATVQAMAVVILSSIAQGIGNLGHGVGGLFSGMVYALIGWVIWAFLSFFIGSRLLPEPQTHADMGQLLRTTGFASSPGILRILGIIPLLGRLITFLVLIWMLLAMVIAVRQALDYRSTGRAVGVCLIGFAVYLIAGIILAALGIF